jgi:hypothetical protein
MFGEYIRSGQGTTRDIYGNVRSSAVDGRSPYVTSNYGTVDTIHLQDGGTVQVSAVDGDSPYVTSNYGTVDTLQLQDGQQVRVSTVDGDSPYIVARSNSQPSYGSARSNGMMPRWWDYAIWGGALAASVGIPFGIGYAVGSAKFKNK